MMKINCSVTLYTKSVVSGVESWSRSIIEYAHWENRKAANVVASGLLEADAVTIWIPTLTQEISMGAGDILVKGKVLDEVDANTFTITDLKNKYEDVVAIRSVDRYDYGSRALQHIRIGAS